VYERGARAHLRRFRQGSTLAVALTALLLFIGGVPGETADQDQPEMPVDPMATDPAIALEQAGGTLRELLFGFYSFLPKLGIALVLMGIAWLVARVVQSALRKTLGQWERTDAVSALATIGVYLAATVIAMSILAGDARALLGSVGLIGLALSWALQTPIESFTDGS
jgi:small conductance mechanosensitive channel